MVNWGPVGHNAAVPRLLFRYFLRELLRVFGISAAVLVLVTAFGAAIKPLAADDLFGPLQTAKFILLAIVPMLQFALPFAAGFAATLVLHRMTVDNEILAAAVGGISYGRLLRPIAALGLALLLVTVLLTQWVIPRFWRLMEQMLAADVARMVVASVDKGTAFRIGELQIYADKAWVMKDPPDNGAHQRLMLIGVVAAKLDAAGGIVADVSARQAVVDVYRREGGTYLMLAMTDTVVFNGKTGEMIGMPQVKPRRPFPVRGAGGDDPMFLTQGELLEIFKRPDRFGPIHATKTALAESLFHLQVSKEVDRRLSSFGRLDLSGQDRTITVLADRLAGRRIERDDGGAVKVREIQQGRPLREVVAVEVSIHRAVEFAIDNPTYDLVLQDCQVVDLTSEGAVNRKNRLTIPNLLITGLTADDLSGLPHEELLARAAGASSGEIAGHALQLQRRVTELRLEIRSRLLRRYAMSLTAMLLPLLGAVLAMWLRDSLPLVIYVWAFAPSILDMLLISGGDHMVRQGQILGGVLIMWSGNGLLLAALTFALIRLMRN